MKSSYLILALGLAVTSACGLSESEKINRANYRSEIVALKDQLEEKVAQAEIQLEISSTELNDESEVINCARLLMDYRFSTNEEGRYNWNVCINNAVEEISESGIAPNSLKMGMKSSFERYCDTHIYMARSFIDCASGLKLDPNVKVKRRNSK